MLVHIPFVLQEAQHGQMLQASASSAAYGMALCKNFRILCKHVHTQLAEAITACEKGGRNREALQLMEDMANASLPLDAIAYSACISACHCPSRSRKHCTAATIRSAPLQLSDLCKLRTQVRSPMIGPWH